MKISENTIAEIIRHGDVSTAFNIIRALLQQIKAKDSQITVLSDTASRLRSLFAETQEERDRLARTVDTLKRICDEHGLGDAVTDAIIHSNLPADPEGAPPPVEDDSNEVTIELE